MESLKDLEKSMKLIRDNSVYGLQLPTIKYVDKTYEYCHNDVLDTYSYLVEYMGNKPVAELVENSRRNNMAKSWLDMVKEGHFYAIDDEGNVVDFGKAYCCSVETCVGCEPEVTLRVTPTKVMKNEGASAHSFERECIVEYKELINSCKEDQELIEKLKKEKEVLNHINEENHRLNERLKKENEELRQQLANYETSLIKIRGKHSPADGVAFADNDPKAVYLYTGRSNGKTQMLKEVLNSMYGTKAFKYDIKKVIFSGPCTIVFWQDGTKTMVRQQEGDVLDKEKGLAMAIAKRVYGDKSNFNDIFKKNIYGKDYRRKFRKVHKVIKNLVELGNQDTADHLTNLMKTNLNEAYETALMYLGHDEQE